MSRHLLQASRAFGMLLLVCAAWLSAGCSRTQLPDAIEVAYIRGGGVAMRDQLGIASGRVITLDGGQKVEVLAKRVRWVQVRLDGGRTGWVQSRFLASPKVFDQFH